MSIASIKSPPPEPPYTRTATDALTHVASFLDYRDLARLSQADKRSNKVAQAVMLKRQTPIQGQLTAAYFKEDLSVSDWESRLLRLFTDQRFSQLSFVQREELLKRVGDIEFLQFCRQSSVSKLHDIYKKLGPTTRFRPLIEKVLCEQQQDSLADRCEDCLDEPLASRVELLWGIENLYFGHETQDCCDVGVYGAELSMKSAKKIVKTILKGWGGTKKIEIVDCRVSSEVFEKLKEAGVEVIASPLLPKQTITGITAVFIAMCLALIILVPNYFWRDVSPIAWYMGMVPAALCFGGGFGAAAAWISGKYFLTSLHYLPSHPHTDELSIPRSRAYLDVEPPYR